MLEPFYQVCTLFISEHAPSCVQNACKKGHDRRIFAKNNYV